jgi:hypothetical protein
MVDDDDNLTPWPPPGEDGKPQQVVLTIPAAEWPNVVDHVAGAMDQLRSQVEQVASADPEPDPQNRPGQPPVTGTMPA